MNPARKSAARKRMKKPVGKWIESNLNELSAIPYGMTGAFQNNRYCVTVYENTKMSEGVTATRLMIQKWDDTPINNHWRELQKIKNELFGEDVTAIEYYPSSKQLIDDHNIYWLFILNIENLPVYLTNNAL